MATSSGEEENSSAPTNFPICFSIIESSDVTEVAVERCPLCCCTRRPFTCSGCVNEGNFIHSKTKDCQSYQDKLKKWEAIKKERSELLERFQSDISGRVSFMKKKTDVQMRKEKLKNLKEAIVASKTLLASDKENIQKLKDENTMLLTRSKKHSEKIQRICRYIKQTNQHTNKQQGILEEKEEELCAIRKEFVDLLVKFIFNLEDVQLTCEADSMVMSTVSALAEARRMSYVRGRWIDLDNGGEMQYRIVEPTLPGNGDYSAYNVWFSREAASAATSGQESELSQRNPGNTISAALCYTVQMISIMAYALDVHLPKRQCYSVFCSNEMSEKHFSKAIAKLNCNILHLCCSQEVNPELLHPLHTLHNILVLLKSESVGRAGPFDVNPDLMQSVFDSSHFSYSDDNESDSSEEEYEGPGDWETVPTNLPELEVPTRSYLSSTSSVQSQAQASHMLPMDTTISTAGGYMSTAAASVASFWRAATGQTEKR
ncbi:beclin 1-associated autophagy-related key regulator-like [Lineus longissimus]|uniref:beclin 1-associated autophagy-related key regulator-like n=1 Tax=Lineus longissimus TaxID=88925 RepID=UPI00315DB8F7